MNIEQEKIICQFKIDNADDLKQISPELLNNIIKELISSIYRGGNNLQISQVGVPEPFHKILTDLYLNLKAAK